VTADVVCPGEWVLLAALRRTEAGELFNLGGRPAWTEPGNPPWRIGVAPVQNAVTGNALAPDPAAKMPQGTFQRLRETLAFRYGHKEATQAPSKQTATQRKGRDKDTEAAENAPEATSVSRNWRKPDFPAAKRGTDHGTAMHTAMQYIQFAACTDENGVEKEMDRLAAEGFLTPRQRDMVDCGEIARFFASELGMRLLRAEETLREFKFSILDDGVNFDPALSGEQILLQGVVDCALVEEDGITVIDFKTDYVTEETLQKTAAYYRPQVKAYAAALERIYQQPVKESYLYFFSIDSYLAV